MLTCYPPLLSLFFFSRSVPFTRAALTSASSSSLVASSLPVAFSRVGSSALFSSLSTSSRGFAALGVSSSPARAFSSAGGGGATPKPPEDPVKSAREAAEKLEKQLAAAQAEQDSITDVIPPKPVTFVEGTSYSLVIVAALGFAAAIIYAALKELLISPKEQRAFEAAFERLRDDPRVSVRLGSPVAAYGTESGNRSARQHVPHREYVDAAGREHVQLQFHLHGPGGRATVNADMYLDPESPTPNEYQYRFLYLMLHGPSPQQVVFAKPSIPDDGTGIFV